MRVLHIIKGLGLAGAERHLIALLAGLRERGIDAQLLLWVSPERGANDVVEAARQCRIPVERWVMPRHIAPLFFLKLLAYLRREKPDFVHTHLVHAETYAIPAARLAGIRYIVNSGHNDDPFRRHPLFRLRSRFIWRLTTRGIAISQSVKRFLLGFEGAGDEQVSVIYYGLQPPAPATSLNLRESLGLLPQARIIGSVCRLVEQKGITYAIDAMKILSEKYPDLHYVIVGDGVLRQALLQQTAILGLQHRVHLLGWREDVAGIMAQFEIFLAPSLWEGFGLVFLEAMGQSRPIVSSNISSIPEVVQDGVTGLLVEPRNPTALANAIGQLLDDPERARQMGQAGRQRLETVFSLESMIEQTAALYREIMR
jgi:glycosyltransferase involved in cell wall biosynthesis